MLKLVNTIGFIFFIANAFSQYDWQWTELEQMPMSTANNAVCEAKVGDNNFVYSFGGIDATKIYSGIHQRSFKYDVQLNTWTEISSLPDTLGKIASGASFVNDKIYIIGGYHVFSDNNELSSDRVHIYNPLNDTYEADGAPIPVQIDDHVQCVYKDSLIYVITGWSDNGNVPDVQIYNPYLDSWQVGTSTPNNAFYKTFGASGYILGDTIYYHGGAAGGSFAARSYMRKGVINSNDPTDITWETITSSPGDDGYRAACSGIGNTVFWIGGSPKSYNYDGVAYDGSGGVNPSARILHFNQNEDAYYDEIAQDYGVMDLRGIANLGNGQWIICGGMDTNQVVSNRTFLLENDLVSIENEETDVIVKYSDSKITIEIKEQESAILINSSGSKIKAFRESDKFEIERSKYPKGMYYFVIGKSRIKLLN